MHDRRVKRDRDERDSPGSRLRRSMTAVGGCCSL